MSLHPEWAKTSHRLQGSIPYVPFLRAPYYVWVGHVPQLATILQENKVEAPPMFPPTFLYTQSWEDPRPDARVRTCQQRWSAAMPITCHLWALRTHRLRTLSNPRVEQVTAAMPCCSRQTFTSVALDSITSSPCHADAA